MRLIKRLLAWFNEPEQLGCPDREIHDRNNENSDVLVTAGERLAIDENTNARGEPDVIYLQLHDPASFDDTEKDDFRADGVTWCRHEINHNDVRYIREDLANPLPAQAVPEGWQLVPVEPTLGMLKEIQLIEEFSARALAVRYKAMLSASTKP